LKKAVIRVLLVTFSVFLGTAGLGRAEDTPGTLVSQGRALLFNNGNPTYSGILAANEKFEQVVVQNPSDPAVKAEANFFYAVTRVLAFGLEEGGGGEFETLLDLFEAFGVTRNDNDSVDAGAPYNDPPQLYDHYDPPGTVPGGESVRQFLSEPVVGVLDDAIENLSVPTTTFNLVLTAVETGDESIEIDYGDILLLRAALHAAKSAMLIAAAYNLDVDLRSLFVLANAEVIQIQRDLLDKYEDLLALLGSGQDSSLFEAKLALRNAIGAYCDAIDFIANEEPYQDDDLFAFDSEDDRNRAEYLSVQLTEVESSLNQNRPAILETSETWRLDDVGNNDVFQFEIVRAADGGFIEGEFRGLDNPAVGDVEEFDVTLTSVSITVTLEGDCPGTATLTGGRNGNQITGGVLSIDDCEGGGSDPFNGTLVLVDTETLEIDFNRIFGVTGTGKAALDIRAVLPNFDTNDELVIGTFPGSPVLNGIVSGLETNDDMTQELDLQPINPNVASLSGTVTCNDHDGTGNIFIWAYDGPDPATAEELGNTHMEAPGAYTIHDLPINATVYLFGRWDADDNGIKTFGDFVGQGGPAIVQAGGTTGVNFSIGTVIDDSFVLTKPGLYRVFGSNTFTFSENGYLGGDPNEIDWGSGWTFIGEGSGTRTLQTGQYFKTILIIWDDNASFYFDAFEDLTAGTALATQADGTPSDYQWITSGLKNLDGDPWVWEPSYFKGHPDGLVAGTEDWAGFSLFTMPDDAVGPDTPRQLRLTLTQQQSHIRGTVTYEGDQTGTLKVLVVYDNASWRYDFAEVVGNPFAVSWAQGDLVKTYEITGLAPGTYKIVAYLDVDGMPPREAGEPIGMKTGVALLNGGLEGQNLVLEVPEFAFSDQKVYPFRRGDLGGQLLLGFFARIPDAEGVRVEGPGVSTTALTRSAMSSWDWGGGVSVDGLENIQTGIYTFTADASSGGPTTATFNLESVPNPPDPVDLLSPYQGTPSVTLLLNDLGPTFSWDEASGAAAYSLRIDQYSGESWYRMYDSGWLSATSHTAQMPLPTGVSLRWYVDAYDATDWASTTAMSRSVAQLFRIGRKGDINLDGVVDLKDVILVLKALAALDPVGIFVEADLDGDGNIGLGEANYVLQCVGLLR